MEQKYSAIQHTSQLIILIISEKCKVFTYLKIYFKKCNWLKQKNPLSGDSFYFNKDFLLGDLGIDNIQLNPVRRTFIATN
jgi:hypothetical protein